MIVIILRNTKNQQIINLTLNIVEYFTTLLNPIDRIFLKFIAPPKMNSTAGTLIRKTSKLINAVHEFFSASFVSDRNEEKLVLFYSIYIL